VNRPRLFPKPTPSSTSQPDPEHIVDHPRRAADPTGPIRPDETAWATAPMSPPDSFGTTRNGELVPLEDTPWSATPIEPADDDLDLLAEVNRKPSRATVLLIAGILATLAFVGGVVVQKHYGGTTTAAGPGGAGGFAGRQGGTAGGAGGYGGFGGGGASGGGLGGGQAGGQAGTGQAGAAAGGAGAGGTGTGSAAATPVVVGTVAKMSGSSLTVKNLGGKSVKVKVPEGASITLVAGKTLTTLKVGATVSVAGTTAADGTVTATSVTVRS
jgi:hypothetical protein